MKNGFYILSDGTKAYYKNDKLHREDGPALIFPSGMKVWYIDDEYHREDGPAIEYANGYKSWYYHDKLIYCSTQEEFTQLIKLRFFW